MKPLLRRITGTAWFHAAVVTAVLLWVFSGPLFSGGTLASGDNAAVYPRDFQVQNLVGLWGAWAWDLAGIGGGGAPFLPQTLLAVLLPPNVWNPGMFIVDTLALFLAALYFLKGRGYRGTALFLPALAFTFSGYGFTLISAGHRGIFHMMPFGVLVLGLVDRGIRSKSPFHLAMAGLCQAYSIIGSSDIGLIFAVLAVFYGGYRAIREWPARGERARFTWRIALGGALAAAVFGLATAGFFQAWTGGGKATRQLQIGEDQSPAKKWEFATNWSMPPEEIVEFFAPCVYGIEPGDPDGPYWGRLGRSLGWEEDRNNPRLFMNFRQHTVYLGVLQMAFAIFGLLAFARRNSTTEGDSVGGAAPEPADRGGDLAFWATVFVAGVLLSLGRHFPPPYRLWYSIPGLSIMRCPVKFMHISELALAVLFAAGISAYARDAGAVAAACAAPARKKETPPDHVILKRFLFAAVAAAVAGAAFMIAAQVGGSFAPALRAHWREIGFGGFQDVLLGLFQGSLRRAGALFFVAAGLFAVPLWKGGRGLAARAAVPVLVLIVAADLSLVCGRFVRTRDMREHFRRNPMTDYLAKNVAEGRVSYHLTQRSRVYPLWASLTVHGVDTIEPTAELTPPAEYMEYFDAIGRDIVRLWTLTSTKYVVAPFQMVEGLLRHPAFKLVNRFETDGARILAWPSAGGRAALVRFDGALPRALVIHSWETTSRSNAFARIAEKDWNPWKSVLVSEGSVPESGPESDPTPARIERRELQSVIIRADTDRPGILLLTDKYDPRWRVRVDGRDAEVLECNAIMRGVFLDAGSHRVEFTYRPFMLQFALSMMPLAVMLVWSGARIAGGRRRRRAAK